MSGLPDALQLTDTDASRKKKTEKRISLPCHPQQTTLNNCSGESSHSDNSVKRRKLVLVESTESAEEQGGSNEATYLFQSTVDGPQEISASIINSKI